MPPTLIKVSVGDLVGFVLRSGDLVSGGFASAARLQEGTRAHQKVQRSRADGYQAEVTVEHQVEADDLCLVIRGRVDGLMVDGDKVLIEEIKSTEGELDPDRPDDPVHWAQAKTYAYILAVQNDLEQVDIQLTYVCLDPWKVSEDRRSFTLDELSLFFTDLITRYLRWARIYHEWCLERDRSIEELTFPFPAYRKGQRDLAAAVYRSIKAQNRLFAQAPTGIGKTISTLFPAVKAMAEGHAEKIFYLTAKTVVRTVAEKAVDELRQNGLKLKSLTLTARDKICFKSTGEESCNTEECEYAIGYFNRINEALEDIFQQDAFTRSTVEEAARKHQVCPFELSLDLSLWSDVIICDYNYVFDPRVYLKRFFLDNTGNYAFLVDEAHNLVDRAREMFSADLYKSEVLAIKRAVNKNHPKLGKKLQAINSHLLKLGRRCEKNGDEEYWVDPELPGELIPLLEQFLDEAEKVLVRNLPYPYWDELIDFYFQVFGFLRIAELFDEHYTTYVEKSGKEVRPRLFCIDPSRNIREALKRGSSAVFFSATLTPLEYFREILGGDEEDVLLSLDSPFPHENLRLLLADHIATTYKKRQSTYGDVAETIAAAIDQKRGNYLIYFPSYRYMEEVASRFAAAHPAVETLLQTSGMSERAREEFLAVFDADNQETMVGFAVMGGIFGEGIDLVGERLSGAVIVGVGLPQLCLERNLIRHYFDAREIAGFEYAYTFPGMNRVLQAAGRVIRTAEDCGLVLLIDQRFGQQRYRRMFPPFWRPVHRTCSPEQIGLSLEMFWNGVSETHYEPL